MALQHSIDKLLYCRGKEDNFIHQLNPAPQITEQMHKIKILVRQTIRDAFREINLIIEKEDYSTLNSHLGNAIDFFVTNPDNKENALADLKKIKPKFSSQGSSVYKTLNTPCQPPQQMDVDDGAYLPMTIFEEHGPVIAKDAFFKIVDTALENLCKKHAWEFVGDKPTCARIIVNKDFHIDIPLYAIPNNEYVSLSTESAMDSVAYKDPQAIKLDPNQVYLAMRDKEHWKASDPREVSEWFKHEVNDIHGEVLRRVCRYLKAWRDHTWAEGGPSSIALMACAVETFNNPDYAKGFNSETEALLSITKHLTHQLKNGITLPFKKDEVLYPRTHEKNTLYDVLTKAEFFNLKLHNALSPPLTKNQCLEHIIEIFGDRIPLKTNYIESIPNRIRQVTPQTQPNSPRNEIQNNFKSG